MKYQELPKWAQEDVYKTIKKWVIEDTPNISEEDFNKFFNFWYLGDYDAFEIEYDEFGENPTVNW